MRITLCGSARFEDQFHAWNELLTLQGHVVYGLAVYPSLKGDTHEWYTAEQKLTLDRVHKFKIDNSDAIVVLNVGGYIGDSTASEIKHAFFKRKNIYWLESPADNLGDNWEGLGPIHLASELLEPVRI